MDNNQQQQELSNYAREVIGHESRQFVVRMGLPAADAEDLAQDISLHLLARLPGFNPARGAYETFVSRLVARRISNARRYRRAARRDYRREICSVHDEVVSAEGARVRFLDTISQDEYDRHTGRHKRPAEERLDLALDVKAILAKLPAKLRYAGELLQSHSIRDAARQLGVPRSTFYLNYLQPLQKFFWAHGLGEYFSRGALTHCRCARYVTNSGRSQRLRQRRRKRRGQTGEEGRVAGRSAADRRDAPAQLRSAGRPRLGNTTPHF